MFFCCVDVVEGEIRKIKHLQRWSSSLGEMPFNGVKIMMLYLLWSSIWDWTQSGELCFAIHTGGDSSKLRICECIRWATMLHSVPAAHDMAPSVPIAICRPPLLCSISYWRLPHKVKYTAKFKTSKTMVQRQGSTGKKKTHTHTFSHTNGKHGQRRSCKQGPCR